MVRRTARFNSHQAGRRRGEEFQRPAAPNRTRDDRRALRVDAMSLKDTLGDVEPDDRDRRPILARLAHGRLLEAIAEPSSGL
jgi:hypothetical protein